MESNIKEEVEVVDLSWMWNCSSNPRNVLDYTELIENPQIAKALNKAAANGFKIALRKMEELNLIQMGDIDRGYFWQDQEIWNSKLGLDR